MPKLFLSKWNVILQATNKYSTNLVQSFFFQTEFVVSDKGLAKPENWWLIIDLLSKFGMQITILCEKSGLFFNQICLLSDMAEVHNILFRVSIYLQFIADWVFSWQGN